MGNVSSTFVCLQCADGQTDRRKDGEMDRWTDGGDGQMNRRTERHRVSQI